MKKLALVTLILLAAFAAVRLTPRNTPSIDRDIAVTVRRAEAVDLAEVPQPLQPSAESAGERSAMAPDSGEAEGDEVPVAEATLGTLRVRVRDSAGDPVPHAVCMLSFHRGSNADRAWPKAHTKANGEALIRDLPPGELTVRLLRGPRGRATIRVGEIEVLDLVLPVGIRVDGEVVDALGNPIDRADIWLSERGQFRKGVPVTRADKRGRFTLKSVSQANYIGAFAPGFGISYLQQPQGEAGVTVTMRFVLDSVAGAVEVEVVDAAGSPIADASVLVGSQVQRSFRHPADGSHSPPPPPRRGMTDSAGRLSLMSIPSGRVEVRAKKAGFGPGVVESEVVAHLPNRVRVTLLPGARVFGRVLDAGGEPVAQASVWAGKRFHFESSHALTGDDGSYSLDGLPRGEALVQAQKTGSGEVEESLVVDAGEARELDLRLLSKPMILGQVVDSEGHGVKGLALLAQEVTTTRRTYAATSGVDGQFSIDVEAGLVFDLSVHRADAWGGFPLLMEKGVRASSQPLLLRLTDPVTQAASLTLRVVDPNGEPALRARLQFWYTDLRLWHEFKADLKTGAFELDGLLPGSIQLTLRHAEHPTMPLGEFELVAGETLDLGERRFPGAGKLVGTLSGALDPERLATLRMSIGMAGGGNGVITRHGMGFESSALAAGEHQLRVSGDFIESVHQSVDIVDGKTTSLEVQLVSAGMCRVIVTPRAGQPEVAWIAGQLLRADGRMLWSGMAWRLEDGTFELKVSAAPGTYTLKLNGASLRKTSRPLTITNLLGSQPALQLTL